MLRGRGHGTTGQLVEPAAAEYGKTAFDVIRTQAMTYRALTFVSGTEDGYLGADAHVCRIPSTVPLTGRDRMAYYSDYFAPPPYLTHASRVPVRVAGQDYPRAEYPTSNLQLYVGEVVNRRHYEYQQSNARTGRAGDTVTGKYLQVNGVLCSGRFMYPSVYGNAGAKQPLNDREVAGAVAPYVDLIADSDNPTSLGSVSVRTMTTFHRVILLRKRARAAKATDYVGAAGNNYDTVGPVNPEAANMERFLNSGAPIVRDFFAPIDPNVVGEMKVLYDKVFETDAETTAKHVGINVQIPEH